MAVTHRTCPGLGLCWNCLCGKNLGLVVTVDDNVATLTDTNDIMILSRVHQRTRDIWISFAGRRCLKNVYACWRVKPRII